MSKFLALQQLMEAEGLPEVAIRAYAELFSQLEAGGSGFIPEAEIEPVSTLISYEELAAPALAPLQPLLAKTVVIKLNGGLGTSMGLDGPKSLLPVKAGLCFLDVIARQILAVREHYAAAVPCLLMNSFRTHEASMECLQKYPDLAVVGLPLDFIQHKVPKIMRETLAPAGWPQDPRLEWCPPGHGDLYAAIQTSGALQALLEGGYEYCFVSNADNLGAVLDAAILNYFAVRDLPFMMEVTTRTAADRKGGHLARRREDGQLLLRESAQCPAAETAVFQDISRYRFFNTNNLWLNLRRLHAVIAEHGCVPLPLICNEKNIDPRDKQSPRVFQLESAMGAAIQVFAGAEALLVPRSRFAPVKQCVDLLAVWSDAYQLSADAVISLHSERGGWPPTLILDERYFALVSDLQARFPRGAPSLLNCESLKVEGDVFFGGGVVVEGVVELINRAPEPRWVADGSRLQGRVEL